MTASDPASPLGRKNIATTCGSCHPQEKAAYIQSSHGRGVAKGDGVSPTCVSCHGGHKISKVHDPSAPTSGARVVFTCAECHEDPAVLRVSNLPYAAVEL
ncbi:MAG TPA: hypothetical protein VN203_06285, partial [Candidatus Acidoferrum sp.]|nr:hypothetical protein [Candidatus Acidoferrum sp.]